MPPPTCCKDQCVLECETLLACVVMPCQSETTQSSLDHSQPITLPSTLCPDFLHVKKRSLIFEIQYILSNISETEEPYDFKDLLPSSADGSCPIEPFDLREYEDSGLVDLSIDWVFKQPFSQEKFVSYCKNRHKACI